MLNSNNFLAECSKLSELGLEMPIIGLTARVFAEDIDKCLQAGMNEVVSKPIDLQELLEAVNGNCSLDQVA